jgi:hypothetical protein
MPTKPRLDGDSNPVFQGGAALRLQADSLRARQREDGCRVLGCREAASELVEVQLPAAWEASERYTVLTVAVAACPEHAPELRRRSAALLVARADACALLAIVDDAVPSERALRDRADVAEARLGLATDQALHAEAALQLLEEVLPDQLKELVATARSAAGVDLLRSLESELESELAAGASGDVALQRVRQAAAAELQQRATKSGGRS